MKINVPRRRLIRRDAEHRFVACDAKLERLFNAGTQGRSAHSQIHGKAAPNGDKPVPADAGLPLRRRAGKQATLCMTRLATILSATLAALASAAVHAAPGDLLTPFASYSVSYDDNLLRLHDHATAQALIGTDKMSDLSRRAQGGVLVEQAIGRQLLSANLSASQARYSSFDELDHTGHDLSAQWNWRVGSLLEGSLGASDVLALTPFIDFHRLEPNMRSQRRQYADFAWRVHPRWRLSGALRRYRLDYDLLSQKSADRDEDTYEVGVDYLAATRSSVGVLLRRTDGDFPHREQFGPTLIDNGYRQSEFKANIDWHVTEKSRLQFLGGRVQRDYERIPTRNFSGFNARMIGTWAPTVKTGITLNVWRETSSYLDVTATSTVNSGIGMTLEWKPTAKLSADAGVRIERRAYFIDDAPEPGSAGQRRDTFRYATVGIGYRPFSALLLKASFYRDQRSSPIPFNEYLARGALLSASVEF